MDIDNVVSNIKSYSNVNIKGTVHSKNKTVIIIISFVVVEHNRSCCAGYPQCYFIYNVRKQYIYQYITIL